MSTPATAPPPVNLPEKLASEIARVAVMRERVRQLDGSDPLLNVRPLLLLMEVALRRAIVAAGMNCAVTQLAALRELETFQESA